MNGLELLFITSVFTIASTVNMIAGFGFALLATPMLMILLDPKATVLFISAASLFLRLIMLADTFPDMQLKTVLICSVGVILGAIPGSYILKLVSNAHLKIILGFVLLASVILMFKKLRLPLQNFTLGRFISGLLCGFSNACTTIGAPFLAIWFVNEDLPPKNLRSNLTWIMTCSIAMTLLGSFFTGIINVLNRPTDLLYCIPGIILGTLLGKRLLNRCDKKTFGHIIQGVIVFGAVSSLAGGIKALL